MTSDQAKQNIKLNDQARAQWTTANAAMTRPFNEFDVALDALEDAYRNRMAVVMAGLVAADSPEEHLEWLAGVERCLAQFELACAWLQHQTETVLPQSMPASAA